MIDAGGTYTVKQLNEALTALALNNDDSIIEIRINTHTMRITRVDSEGKTTKTLQRLTL